MFIQQVAKKLNITTRTIRHYEDLGIIKSNRLENNYRVYDTKNYDKLKFLVRARNLVFSLKECKELIKLFENNTRKSASVRDIAKKKEKPSACLYLSFSLLVPFFLITYFSFQKYLQHPFQKVKDMITLRCCERVYL